MLLPNLITLLALCAGLTAIRLAVEEKLEWAVAAIVFAALLDGIDGRIARLLKGTSRFGAELDSLADFVNFGVAPALMVYFWSLHELKSAGWIASRDNPRRDAATALVASRPAPHAALASDSPSLSPSHPEHPQDPERPARLN